VKWVKAVTYGPLCLDSSQLHGSAGLGDGNTAIIVG